MIEPAEGRAAGITRRQALKRGTLVAGTALWVTPVVHALAMSPASAQRPSGAGRGAGSGRGAGAGRGAGRGVGRARAAGGRPPRP